MSKTGIAALAFAAVLWPGSSVLLGQSLDFRIEGPTEVSAGEYVELRVELPDGVPADVTFVPVDEDRFGVHPIVEETIVDGKLVPTLRGRVCTFSARCLGDRELTVVATAFATVEGVPRILSLRHRIRVTQPERPAPPTPVPPHEPPVDPPTAPPKEDDDFGPRVPLPNASVSDGDLDKIVRILGDVVDRLEALEQRQSQSDAGSASHVSISSGAVAIARKVATPIVDARPGHWSVASAANEWNPTKAEAIAHLRRSHPATAQLHEPLEALPLDAILTLHDDAHEGRLSSTFPAAIDVHSSATSYVVPAATPCPGGVCPTSTRSDYTTGPFGLIRWRR